MTQGSFLQEKDMNLAIQSFVGVGDIMLGDSSDNIRNIVKGRVRSLRKTPTSVSPMDQFIDAGIMIHFDSANVCKSIELVPPANPTFLGREFLRKPVQTVLAWLSELDKITQLDRSGTVFLQLGISLYSSQGINDPASRVDSVTVFQKGYYDDLLESLALRKKKASCPTTPVS
jgi:hypothetical protein